MKPSRKSEGDHMYQHGKGCEAAIAENIYKIYRNENADSINIAKLFGAIRQTGIRVATDPRLKSFYKNVTSYKDKYGKRNEPIENLVVDEATFYRLIADDLPVLSRIVKNDFIIPDFPGFTSQLEEIFNMCASNKEGYIPTYPGTQEGKQDRDTWAMSICTIDGQRFSLGDVDKPFKMQSCSKPFTYAMCLNDLGEELVHKHIGQEPSGRNINEICLDDKNMPHNPMLNSGAMMSAALILDLIEPRNQGLAEKYDYIYGNMKRLAGGEKIGFNNSVFLSERAAADRRFAMAYYMKEYKCYPDENIDINECMDLYFQVTSMEVNAESLAVMAATLANGGICPTTGDKVVQSEAVRDVLSLMFSCGMYNYSGQFAFKVGLPAKSGASGCIMVVIPNLMAVALWSPPLDDGGNSARGIQFCEEMVKVFNFHRFDNLKHSREKKDPQRNPHEIRSAATLALLFGASAGDVSSLHRNFLQGVDMNLSDYDGRTALHLAAAEGHIQAVKFLLETCGVKPCPKDRWGHEPVDDALRFGHDNVVELLSQYNPKKSS